ncbi:MAG: tetratricopeptide repeat protein, partial [Bacteroidetes Order II. Incertae sedis bacterium]|nr:tetratricopeptide repeat protein [Bacteroidetes Order II. bacterium]
NQDYDRAIKNLETALEKDSTNSEALELKGRVLQQKAFSTMDQAEHIDLIHQMVEAFTAAKNIDPLLNETVAMSMAYAHRDEFNLGIQAFNRGQNNDSEFVVAARYFHTAGDIYPDSSDAYANEAVAYMNANQPEDAIVPYEMALERGDSAPTTYQQLASLYLTYDRQEEGIALLEDAANQFPENADVQTELLNAYQASGQIDKALESYKTAVDREPDNKLFRFNYGTLLTETENYEAAVAQLVKATELDSLYTNAFYNLGAAYINMAVDVNDQVRVLDEALSAERGDLSRDQISEREAAINVLVDKRRAIFGLAIAPLETAKSLFESAGEDATGVCMALYQSYVQINELDKARSVEECAGYSDTGE